MTAGGAPRVNRLFGSPLRPSTSKHWIRNAAVKVPRATLFYSLPSLIPTAFRRGRAAIATSEANSISFSTSARLHPHRKAPPGEGGASQFQVLAVGSALLPALAGQLLRCGVLCRLAVHREVDQLQLAGLGLQLAAEDVDCHKLRPESMPAVGNVRWRHNSTFTEKCSWTRRCGPEKMDVCPTSTARFSSAESIVTLAGHHRADRRQLA